MGQSKMSADYLGLQRKIGPFWKETLSDIVNR